MTADKMPEFCTIRDGADEIHLECRFSDGQKYAAVMVDIECPSLADFLAKAINTRTDLPDPRLEILAAALRLIEQHHAWHQEIGTVYFADADGKDYIPVDLSDGYCDSKLCDDTVKVLRALRDTGMVG